MAYLNSVMVQGSWWDHSIVSCILCSGSTVETSRLQWRERKEKMNKCLNNAQYPMNEFEDM